MLNKHACPRRTFQAPIHTPAPPRPETPGPVKPNPNSLTETCIHSVSSQLITLALVQPILPCIRQYVSKVAPPAFKAYLPDFALGFRIKTSWHDCPTGTSGTLVGRAKIGTRAINGEAYDKDIGYILEYAYNSGMLKKYQFYQLDNKHDLLRH